MPFETKRARYQYYTQYLTDYNFETKSDHQNLITLSF